MQRYPLSLLPRDLSIEPDASKRIVGTHKYSVFIERPGEYAAKEVGAFLDRNKAYRYAAELSMRTDDVGDVVHVSWIGPMLKTKHGQTVTTAYFIDGEYIPKERRAPPTWIFGKAGRYQTDTNKGARRETKSSSMHKLEELEALQRMLPRRPNKRRVHTRGE